MKDYNQYLAGIDEWNVKFGFLKKSQLDNVYLAILAMAKSKSDIASIHALLPRNRQLLRKDLIELENFWVKYIKLDDQDEDKAGNFTKNWLLAKQCNHLDNAQYYADYLRERTVEPQGDLCTSPLSHHNIMGSWERSGHGCAHFHIDLLYPDWREDDPGLRLECYLSKGEKSIIARLVVYSKHLTEALTYFLGNLPGYVMCSLSYGPEGEEIALAYSWPADEDTKTKLIPHTSGNPDGYGYMSTPEFIESVRVNLRVLGVPVNVIYPIL